MGNDFYTESVPVEQMVCTNMVRYDRLNKLIPYAFTGSTANQLNVYVDLFPIYRNIISRHYRTNTKDYISLVPAIINLCVHYRQFFRKLEVECKFFLISSYNVPPINCKMVANYNKVMTEKLKVPVVADMVKFNAELLDILCPYLPDIFYIPSEFESSVVIEYLIEKQKNEGDNTPSLIISRDTLPVQILARYNDVALLKPSKLQGEDVSQIIPPNTHNSFLKHFNQVVYGVNSNIASEKVPPIVLPPNYVLLLALSMFKSRCMDSIMRTNVAAKLINEVSPNISISMGTLFDLRPELEVRYPRAIMENRFKALDNQFMLSYFLDSKDCIELHYENLIDPGAIALINSKYFPNNPIDIYRL